MLIQRYPFLKIYVFQTNSQKKEEVNKKTDTNAEDKSSQPGSSKKVIDQLFKKKLSKLKRSESTRESKLNLKKETQSKIYDFGPGNRFTRYNETSNTQELKERQLIEREKKQIVESSGQLDRLIEIMKKSKGLDDLDRVDIIQSMLGDVRLCNQHF